MIATKAIGVMEILMFIWVISRIKARFSAISLIIIVAVMNTIEFILVPDMLLFGKWNSVVALIFIFVVYYNEFVLNSPKPQNA